MDNLLAAVSAADFYEKAPQIAVWGFVLCVVIILGFCTICKIRKSLNKGKVDPHAEAANSMMASIREAFERGEIDEAEYRSIRERLVSRLYYVWLGEETEKENQGGDIFDR
ncbi:MAG: hypothetical protein Q4D38_00905 [Planctomycetia bacterium]|nr:hypothetical protein [Planctomycetia bacterium]